MKRFIKIILFHFSFVVIFLVGVCFFLYKTIQTNASFTISPATKYVVLGSSHSECSIDDRIIDSLENFSRSGEAYAYTYAKLKCLLSCNKNIKTIFLEFSNPFIYDDEEWLWSEKYLNYHYITFAPFLSIEDHVKLFSGHFKSWTKTTSFFIKDAGRKVIKKDYDFSKYGGHIKSEKIMDTSYNQTTLQCGQLNIQIHFLDKIVECCKENDVELIFVRSPLYPTFKYWKTENEFQQIYRNRYLFIDTIS